MGGIGRSPGATGVSMMMTSSWEKPRLAGKAKSKPWKGAREIYQFRHGPTGVTGLSPKDPRNSLQLEHATTLRPRALTRCMFGLAVSHLVTGTLDNHLPGGR